MRTLLLLIALTACPSAEDDGVAQDDADDFASRLADDIADLAATPVDVASTVDDLEARDTDRVCYPTVGTCSFCYDVDGTPLAGTFSLGMEDTPCGVAWEISGRSLNYSITATDITGTWFAAGLGGSYSVEATGDREGVLSTNSPRGGSHDFDSSYTMTLTAGIVNFGLDALTLEMTYDAFTGRTWEVDVTGDGDSLDGTATTSDGITCTVSAGHEAPSVSCTASGS